MTKKEKIDKNFLKNVQEYAQGHPLVKFLAVFLIFAVYILFTVKRFGFIDGLLVGLLTWSFFVFCTPIVGAGLLLDFPLRLLLGIRMLYSEISVWIMAFLLNLFVLLTSSSIYEKTILLSLFKKILIQPFPFWGIIILSGIGTFFSVYFGDEILDISFRKLKIRKKYGKYKNKYQLIILFSIIILVIILYYFLLKELNINIPLF